jgi:hypothetical protein
MESTEGTEAAPNPSTDAKILNVNAQFKIETKQIERNLVGPGFARKRSLIAEKLARITFETEIMGSGTAGTPTTWATLLAACGFKHTNVASTSDTYDPVTNPSTFDNTGAAGNSSLTIYVYEDGIVKKARGCRGTFRIKGEGGNPCMIEWEFLGVYVGTADVAYPTLSSGADGSTVNPPLLESAAFTFQGLASDIVLIKSLNLDIGNNIVPRWDVNVSSGVKSIFISDRRVTGSIDPEAMLTADFDPIARLNTPTVGAFNITIGTTAGNKFTITAPAAECQIVDVQEGERDGILHYTLNLQFNCPVVEDANNKEIRFALV